MNKYEKPKIIAITRKEINEKIVASASCENALCKVGDTYTCNQNSQYNCNNYTEGTVPCPSGYVFTCSSTVSHTDAFEGEKE